MPDNPLDEYLATVRPDARETVRVLAAAVDAAGAGFDVKVTYRMLVYTFDARWHRWVVAIGVSKSAVNLRFLFGKDLADPAGILRPGSTTAATADFESAREVDPGIVTAYVREAVAGHPSRA